MFLLCLEAHSTTQLVVDSSRLWACLCKGDILFTYGIIINIDITIILNIGQPVQTQLNNEFIICRDISNSSTISMLSWYRCLGLTLTLGSKTWFTHKHWYNDNQYLWKSLSTHYHSDTSFEIAFKILTFDQCAIPSNIIAFYSFCGGGDCVA